jgi:hypothetical protein
MFGDKHININQRKGIIGYGVLYVNVGHKDTLHI